MIYDNERHAVHGRGYRERDGDPAVHAAEGARVPGVVRVGSAPVRGAGVRGRRTLGAGRLHCRRRPRQAEGSTIAPSAAQIGSTRAIAR